MVTPKHPNRISPRHSALSVGYSDQDAVYHVCISCHHLGNIDPRKCVEVGVMTIRERDGGVVTGVNA